MTFLKLKQFCENLTHFQLAQQVTLNEDGIFWPIEVIDEGQDNLYFVYDFDESPINDHNRDTA